MTLAKLHLEILYVVLMALSAKKVPDTPALRFLLFRVLAEWGLLIQEHKGQLS